MNIYEKNCKRGYICNSLKIFARDKIKPKTNVGDCPKGGKMKRVILAIVNSLVEEAVGNALNKAGFFVENSPSQKTDDVTKVCDIFCANLLLMDVTRTGEGQFENRMQTLKEVKRLNPQIKTGLFCDNVSDPDVAYKVKTAKEEGSVDVFFYESVKTDYMTDVLDAL